MEQNKYQEYLLFLEKINEILKRTQESEKEKEEIKKRLKIIIYLIKIQKYELVEAMIKYYLILELKQYKEIIEK